MEYKKKIERFADILSSGKHIVFLTGAGVSTASGIPDFRGTGGLYTNGSGMEEKLSHGYLQRNPRKFYKFYFETMMSAMDGKDPCKAHLAMAELEKMGLQVEVVTQNIDGLHQKAGNTQVVEMHVTGVNWICKNEKCRHEVPAENVRGCMAEDGMPRCPKCGKLIRPNIVLYGESLDEEKLYDATCAVGRADTLVVCGTSLTVYPVANLPNNYWGYPVRIVVINNQETYLDKTAGLVFREDIGQVLSDAIEVVKEKQGA